MHSVMWNDITHPCAKLCDLQTCFLFSNRHTHKYASTDSSLIFSLVPASLHSFELRREGTGWAECGGIRARKTVTWGWIILWQNGWGLNTESELLRWLGKYIHGKHQYTGSCAIFKVSQHLTQELLDCANNDSLNATVITTPVMWQIEVLPQPAINARSD